MFKKSDIDIQVKLEVVSKGTCVAVLICEKTTQIKRVSKKVHRFRFWSNQVRSQKDNNDIKVTIVNASTQTDGKIHGLP